MKRTQKQIMYFENSTFKIYIITRPSDELKHLWNHCCIYALMAVIVVATMLIWLPVFKHYQVPATVRTIDIGAVWHEMIFWQLKGPPG